MENIDASAFQVRLGWPWRIIAPSLASVAFAYPLLVHYIELRRLGQGDVLPSVGVLLFAVCYWLYTSHSAYATEDSVTFQSGFRRRAVNWTDVASVEVTPSWVVATDRAGIRYRVSAYANNAFVLADRLHAYSHPGHGGLV